MSETRLREDICRFGRSLFERGLTPGSSGNISVRLEDGGYLVTPTNASLGFLDPAKLSRLEADGRLVSGDAPTKEVPLHSALYQTRTAARAVVHLHSTWLTALSCLEDVNADNVIRPFTPYYVMKVGKMPLIPYFKPGSQKIADALARHAASSNAFLLANHGPVVIGRTLEEAVAAMEELEETAKLFFILKGHAIRYLSPDEIRELES